MPVSQPSDPREQNHFKSLLRQTVIVPVVALAILAASLLWGIQSLRNSSQWVDHTDQVIGDSQELLKLIIDMETGVRGYLAYGGDEFLQPYNEAESVIDSKFDALNQLVADNPSQQARLAAVRSHFDQWRTETARAIELRRSSADGGYAAALQRKHLMDSVREQDSAFRAVERRLRDERVKTSQKAAKLLIVACVLLSVIIGGFLAVFTRRRMHLLGAQFQESLDTAEKRAEALQESEQQFRTLANGIPQLAWMANPDGFIFWYNQRWYEYTALPNRWKVGVGDRCTIPRCCRKSLSSGKVQSRLESRSTWFSHCGALTACFVRS